MNNIVLLIENDKDTVVKAAQALEGAGYNIVGADTAQEGTDKANELTPILILVNLATPGANGLELCKSLHNPEALTEVPIILLTLREGKFEPVYTKLYGIVSFLQKPFNDDELLALAQEHSPVAEVDGSIEDDATMEMGGDAGEDEFATMEMDAGGDAGEDEFATMEMDAGGDEGVFSIDETEQSLDDLQSSFQEQLEEDTDMSADTSGEMDDEFEGTQQFSLEDTGEMDSASDGENAEEAGEDAGGGDWGAMDSGDTEEAGGGDWGEMDSGGTEEEAGEDAGGGDWGEMDSGGAEEEAGGDWGAMDSGDADEEAGGGAGEMDSSGAEEDMDDADSTLKMDLAKSGWGEMDIDDSEGTAGAEDADSGFDVEDTMQMDAQDSTGETEEPMSDDTPSFDDEPMGDDETFMDDSIAGDDDLPQMDVEDEDYSELFADSEEAEEDTGKGKKKKKKAKKKKDKKAGGKSPVKRILVLVLLLLILGGGGFAAYTFFLAEEPATKVTVTRQPASAPSPDMDEEPPADLLMELEEEQALAEPEPEAEALAPEPRKETAKPEPATGAAIKGAYYVQFGVFGVRENAERLAFSVEKEGLKPLIQPKKSAGRTVNYVLLDEPFSSWGKASKKASQVKSSTGLDTAVYKIK